jgi:mevalonate pyrophosphate decarboxylase
VISLDKFLINEFMTKGKRIYSKLKDKGLIQSLPQIEPQPEDGRITFGSGYPVKAVEKFIGYFDPEMKIAYSPSLSFCTDFSISRSYCLYTKEEGCDLVHLDGSYSEERTTTAKKALNIFRRLTGVSGSFIFYVERERKYVKAKGMSESSSVAAAVARSLVSNVYGSKSKGIELLTSRFAKFVSGSGTRSSISGLSLWTSFPGMEEKDCYAHPVRFDSNAINIAVFPKFANFSTNQMHEASVNSPQYPVWLENKYASIEKLIDNDFPVEDLLSRAEEEMLNLNSILMSVGKVLQTEDSLALIERIVAFRKNKPGLYFTTDTGPSVLVMSRDKKLLEEFLEGENDFYIRGRIMDKNVQQNSDPFKERARGFFSDFMHLNI